MKTLYVLPDLFYDPDHRDLYFNHKKIVLTKRESEILYLLLEKKGQIVSRSELMFNLWQTDRFISPGTLTTAISRLRQSLYLQTGKRIIKTSKGRGYYIE